MAKQLELNISGMTCGHCAMSVTKELSKLEGAAEIKVDPQAGSASLIVDESVEAADIAAAVEEAGYTLVSSNA
ncbi:MAG: heavy-metal-associated domain-containing protein [Rhodoluna sp.]|nr:heavy-metal-associated domain-containing protein [Rhodoluna sp.]